ERHQREGAWTAGAVTTVTGRSIAILGLGKTGQAVAKLAKALGMQVLGIRARPAATAGADRVESIERLHDVLRAADYLAICLPLTPATRGLLDEAAFAALKPGAILVDVSRGGIVRQAALLAPLRESPIPPPVPHPLH